MSVEVFPIGLLAIAVGAGLLAVFVVWVSKRIASPETRSQGITVAALVAGIVLLGLFVTRSNVQPQAAQQVQPIIHSSAPASTGFSGRVSSDHDGRLEIRAESNIQGQVYPELVGRGRMATWAIVAVIAGGIVLLIASMKSLPAALAALALIAALVVIFTYSSLDVQTARMPSVGPPTQPPTDSTQRAEPTPRAAELNSGDHSVTAEGEASTLTISEPTKEASAVAAERNTTETTPAEKNVPRPGWVGQAATYDKETHVYRVNIVSGPYATEEECERRLYDPLQHAVRSYAGRYLRPNVQHYAWLDALYNRNQIIKDRYLETTQASFGPMLKLHALVEIGQSDVARYEQLAHEAEIRERVAITGTFAASVIGVLAVAYGALRYMGRKKPPVESPAVATENTA